VLLFLHVRMLASPILGTDREVLLPVPLVPLDRADSREVGHQPIDVGCVTRQEAELEISRAVLAPTGPVADHRKAGVEQTVQRRQRQELGVREELRPDRPRACHLVDLLSIPRGLARTGFLIRCARLGAGVGQRQRVQLWVETQMFIEMTIGGIPPIPVITDTSMIIDVPRLLVRRRLMLVLASAAVAEVATFVCHGIADVTAPRVGDEPMCDHVATAAEVGCGTRCSRPRSFKARTILSRGIGETYSPRSSFRTVRGSAGASALTFRTR